MAAYKYPRVFEIVDALPMTATGKILKRELSQAGRLLDSGLLAGPAAATVTQP